MEKNSDPVLEYAQAVINNQITACASMKLACQRHINDLAKQNDHAFPFYYDQKSASRIIRFAQLMPTVKGQIRKLPLQPWQSFILGSLFGWKRKNSNLRRFRTAYIQVARKNGKSTLAAIIALYMLVLDKEQGAEVYSVATTRDQAKIVYDTALAMCKRCPEFVNDFHIDIGLRQILHKPSLSKFCHLSSDSKSLEGLDTHCAIIDELHAHPTREVFDVMESSTGARSQPLIFIITTAGTNLTGVGHEVYQYSKEVLQSASNDAHFVAIFELDSEEEYRDKSKWIKANPNLNISLHPDDIEAKLHKATTMQSAKANFLTKHMNLWLHSDSSWIDVQNWIEIENPKLSIQDVQKYPCYVGIDLATRIDLASVAFLFIGPEKYYLITRHYIPSSKLDIHLYQTFNQSGHLQACDGNSLSLTQIEQDILSLSESLQIQAVAYDPYQSKMLAEHLEERGIDAIEFRQTVMNMSPNMRILESWIVDKKLESDSNAVMRWCVQNTVCHTDAKDNIYPRKSKPENKIDGVVATIMAVGISQVSVRKTLEDEAKKPVIFQLG